MYLKPSGHTPISCLNINIFYNFEWNLNVSSQQLVLLSPYWSKMYMMLGFDLLPILSFTDANRLHTNAHSKDYSAQF